VASKRCLLLERRAKMKKVKLTVFVTVLAASVLATAAFASTKTSTIALRSTAVGKVIVGANGRTLYLFTADKGTKSVCYGQCATYWPPLIAGKPTVGAGLTASKLGTTKRKDGKLQVTYDGHPLYFFALDKKAGEIKGQGYVHFGGTWWTVSAAGTKITKKP
jgi:predicted lipoprotein with Yx(FWY)xxD motif